METGFQSLPNSYGFWFHLWISFFSGISTVEDSVDAVCGGITSLNYPAFPLFGSNKWLLHVTTNTHHPLVSE